MTVRRSRRRFLVAAAVGGVLALAGGVVSVAPAQALWGPLTVRQGEYPYFAWTVTCGGVMVDPEWLLTAASCTDSSIIGTRVRISGTSARIDSVAREFRKAPGGVDAALVRIDRVANVPIVALAERSPSVGDTYSNVAKGSGSPDQVGVGAYRVDSVPSATTFTGRNADDKTRNCWGDTGSPAIISTPEGDKLAGVLSDVRVPAGDTFCESGNQQAVITSVTSGDVRNWIRGIIYNEGGFTAAHQGYWRLTNVSTGRVLDMRDFSTVPGGQAFQWGATGSTNQQWYFQASAGRTEILNRNSGLVLGTAGGSAAAGSAIVQGTAAGSADQGWVLRPVSDGTYRIVNLGSGQNLTVRGGDRSDGADVILWPETNGTEQQWRLTQLAGADFASTHAAGYYTIRNLHSGRVLDVSDNSTSLGGKAIVWPGNGGTNQQWRFRTISGKTEIVNRNSGLVLEIPNGSTAADAPAWQWADLSGANQRWTVTQTAQGSYTIANDNSRMLLSASTIVPTVGGAPATQRPDNGTGFEQRWELIPVAG